MGRGPAEICSAREYPSSAAKISALAPPTPVDDGCRRGTAGTEVTRSLAAGPVIAALAALVDAIVDAGYYPAI